MKITKFNQSCLLIETKGKRILIDPGNIGYTNELEKYWTDIDTLKQTLEKENIDYKILQLFESIEV